MLCTHPEVVGRGDHLGFSCMSFCCQAKGPILLHVTPFHPWHGDGVQHFSSVTQHWLRHLSRKKRREFPKRKDSARGLKSTVGNTSWLGLSELPFCPLGHENGTKKPQKIFPAYTEVSLEKGFGLQTNQNYDLTGTTEV